MIRLRLGGMNMLMSFIRVIGTLMSGSGLEEVMNDKAFRGVSKMLTGKTKPLRTMSCQAKNSQTNIKDLY